MKYKPIDEISVRHLFSTAFAQELLKLSYIGPVLNSTGTIETSPDCMILDMRSHPFKPLRCEFKFIPLGKEDFSHNGRFDIAIVWTLSSSLPKLQLLNDLLQQNGCYDLIVLEDFKAFRDLPVYTTESLSNLGDSGIVRQLALNREFPSVFALNLAADLYPGTFQMDQMVEFLCKRFPSVKKMQPRGRANVVSAFIQTKPPLLVQLRKNNYRWTSEIDSKTSASELKELITTNFLESPPTKDDLEMLLS